MNHQTQGALTVLISTVVFGIAGYWLLPNQTKGALAGAIAGAAASTNHIYHQKRIREITHNLNAIETRLKRTRGPVNIPEPPNKVQGQMILNVKEVNRLRSKIDELEARLVNNQNTQANHLINMRIEILEAKIESAISAIDITKTEPTAEEINHHDDDLIIREEGVQKIIDWFDSKGVSLENYYEPDLAVDNLLDGLSIYLGDNYSILNKFHWRLRNSVGKTLRFNLEEFDSRTKSIHKQYLKKLRVSDYLSNGRLIKQINKPDFILASSHDRPDIQGFFNGGWFERFIYYRTVELLDSEGIDYQYIRGAKIVYPNNENNEYSELDLFFLINNQPLLIECKSGQNYDEGIKKFVQHRERLGLKTNEAIFAVLDIDAAEAHIRTRNWKITVTDQNNFLAVIRQLAISQEDGTAASDVTIEDQELGAASTSTNEKEETIESFFRRSGLNLAPEYRITVIEELVNLFKDLSEPMSFNDISKILRDRMKDKYSLGRSKITEILSCLRYSDIFRDNNHKPVRNTSFPIFSMSSMKIETLERKCMEIYAGRILQQFDPDFFEIENNITEFERLTSGKAPSNDRISRLK